VYLNVKILGKCPKINFFSSLSTLDNIFDDFSRNPEKKFSGFGFKTSA
jgi:hypothetical protein